MRRYYTKSGLYKEVDNIKSHIGIESNQFPINSVELCKCNDAYAVAYLPFKTKGLQGMLLTEDGINLIILNQNQSSCERNFFCTHELMHSALHRNLGLPAFNCFDTIQPQQDRFLEWQANEGAAQFLVPFQDFIPRFSALLDSPPHRDFWFQGYLAEFYGVSTQVISHRIANLSYEIDQYRRGVALKDIEVLSASQQQKLGIVSTNYSVICDFGLDWESKIG